MHPVLTRKAERALHEIVQRPFELCFASGLYRARDAHCDGFVLAHSTAVDFGGVRGLSDSSNIIIYSFGSDFNQVCDSVWLQHIKVMPSFISLSERRETAPCRSSCVRRLRLRVRAETFRSLNARRGGR